MTTATLQQVLGLDLRKVKTRLTDPKKHNMNDADAERAITNFKRFFFLCGVEDAPIVPTEEVDQVWHEYLLFTTEYHNTCQTLFNRFIHHEPSMGTAEENRKLHRAAERTKRLYVKHFGEGVLGSIYRAAECTDCDGSEGCHTCSGKTCCNTNNGGTGGVMRALVVEG